VYAILNYFDDPVLSEIQRVREGDIVVAKPGGEEFSLTKGKEYEVLEINNFTMFSIRNDKGNVEIYTVEYFDKKY
jgi:hypothetical protein